MTFLRPSFTQNEPPVSFPAAYSYSTTPSPLDFGAVAAESSPRRRGRAERRPRMPPGLPAPARGPPPHAPQPLSPTEACAAPSHRRLALPRPERHAPPPPVAVRRRELPRKPSPCTSPYAAGRPVPRPPWALRSAPPQLRWSAPPAGSAAAGCAWPRAARACEAEEGAGLAP